MPEGQSLRKPDDDDAVALVGKEEEKEIDTEDIAMTKYLPLYHCCNSFLSKWVDFCNSSSWVGESFDCLRVGEYY